MAFFKHKDIFVCVKVTSRLIGFQIIPKSLRQKWQERVNQLDSLLGGTRDSPISSILLMLETPLQMVVVCTAGQCALQYMESIKTIAAMYSVSGRNTCTEYYWHKYD